MLDELATQVAKIQIGDPKQATAYVYVLAEKIDVTDTELYVLCELPLFNPAAAADCERIAEAIAASLKRSYRKTVSDNTFENALAQINDELGKLAGLGKTHWIGKLNALVAAKRGRTLSIATVGKITALLLRDTHFTAVAEATTAPTPLKTFENFAMGKLRLNDVLIFSTSQLFNHISIDRIGQILDNENLPDAAGQIIGILKDNAGPEVASVTILALQVEPGLESDEEIDLKPYLDEPGKASMGAATFIESAKSLGQRAIKPLWHLKKLRASLKNAPRPDVRKAAGVVNQQFKRAAQNLRPDQFRQFSKQKKFFLISAAVLLLALVASLVVTAHYKNVKVAATASADKISALQKLADDASASIIYNDPAKARSLLDQLNSGLAGYANADKSTQALLDPIRKEAVEIDDKLSKRATVETTTVATLGNANHLIVLPGYLATETNRTIISYNRANGKVEDNALHVSEPVAQSIFIKNSSAVIHNGKELFLWNFQTGIVGSAFSDSVPDNFVGLKLYPTNNRVYTIDKGGNRVMSFAVSDKAITKPVVAISGAGDLSHASDLAIDGNVYVLVDGTLKKFNQGKLQDFKPALPSPLSDSALIYTEGAYKNLYILDVGNKRIIVLDKKGALVETLLSPQFTNLKDFAVDEKTKTIFVLNDGSLLKLNY